MDMASLERQLAGYFGMVAAWWHSGSAWPMWIWMGTGLAFAVACAYAAYWLVRRTMGYERINGAWIGPDDLARVLDRLVQRERDSGSMTVEDLKLLDRFRPGRHNRLHKLGERDYVSW